MDQQQCIAAQEIISYVQKKGMDRKKVEEEESWTVGVLTVCMCWWQ